MEKAAKKCSRIHQSMHREILQQLIEEGQGIKHGEWEIPLVPHANFATFRHSMVVNESLTATCRINIYLKPKVYTADFRH